MITFVIYIGGDMQRPVYIWRHNHTAMDNTSTAPRYKVVRIYRNSARRVTLERNLSQSEAQRCVRRFADSPTSMVVYFQQ